MVQFEQISTACNITTGTNITSSSINGGTNCLWIAVVGCRSNRSLNNVIDSEGHFTWNIIKTQPSGRGQITIFVAVAIGTIFSNFTVTANLTSTSSTRSIAVLKYS